MTLCWVQHRAEIFMFTFCTFFKILSISPLLSKKLWFVSTTNTATTFDNFNEFLSFRVYFFIYILIFCFTMMSTSDTRCTYHLTTKNLNFKQEHSVGSQYKFFSSFTQNIFSLILRISSFMPKKIFYLVFCCCEILSFPETSPNTSSTSSWLFSLC